MKKRVTITSSNIDEVIKRAKKAMMTNNYKSECVWIIYCPKHKQPHFFSKTTGKACWDALEKQLLT